MLRVKERFQKDTPGKGQRQKSTTDSVGQAKDLIETVWQTIT